MTHRLAILERAGHEVVVAETGRQALELHARGNIDVILSNAAAVFTRLDAEASRLVTALRAFGGPETCAS